MIESLATAVHSSLYIHIRFRTFRITIRPNWNNCYILSYLSKMKRIFWLTLLPSSVYKYDNWSIFLWMQARFLFGAWSRICRENLLFDRKRSEIWLVITGHVKTKGDYESDSFEQSFEHIRWYRNTKADKYTSFYLFLPPSGQLVYFYEAEYYCIILIHYLHAEDLLAGKYLRRSLFLISQ